MIKMLFYGNNYIMVENITIDRLTFLQNEDEIKSLHSSLHITSDEPFTKYYVKLNDGVVTEVYGVLPNDLHNLYRLHLVDYKDHIKIIALKQELEELSELFNEYKPDFNGDFSIIQKRKIIIHKILTEVLEKLQKMD